MSCDFMGHSVCIGGGKNLRKVKADKKKMFFHSGILNFKKVKNNLKK